LRQWLRSLHHEINLTSIFVTHDQEEALEVANRVVVMDKGRIEQVGTPDEVYDSPATAFVHGFIGESIELPVQVGDGAVRLDGKSLDIAADGLQSGPSRLFIRRHDMQLCAAGSGAFEGAVTHVRTFGPIQRAEVKLAQGQAAIEIDAPRDNQLRVGDIVGLTPRRYRIFATAG
jgi:sulfate transport system ATP-binding protein